jgi:hypothetical protein
MDHRGYLIGPWVDWFSLRSQIETAVPRSNLYEDAGDILYIFDACSAGVAGIYDDGPEVLAACGWDAIAGSSLANSDHKTSRSRIWWHDIPAMPVHIPHPKNPSIMIPFPVTVVSGSEARAVQQAA